MRARRGAVRNPHLDALLAARGGVRREVEALKGLTVPSASCWRFNTIAETADRLAAAARHLEAVQVVHDEWQRLQDAAPAPTRSRYLVQRNGFEILDRCATVPEACARVQALAAETEERMRYMHKGRTVEVDGNGKGTARYVTVYALPSRAIVQREYFEVLDREDGSHV